MVSFLHLCVKHGIYFNFVLANIDSAIAGWDWLVRYKLDLQWLKNGQCQLKDPKAKYPITLSLIPVQKEHLRLPPCSSGIGIFL